MAGSNRRTREQSCPSANLSTTNLTKTGLGSNPRLSGHRPATHLTHGRVGVACYVGKCVAVRVKGTVARGAVTGTAGACKVSQLFVSVRYVAVESMRGSPSKLIVAKPGTNTLLLINQ